MRLAGALTAVIVTGCAVCKPAVAGERSDLARHVNVFAGTDSGAPDFGTGGGAGNTFPAATVPHGMVQFGPDTFPSTVNFAGGYSYGDKRLRGFSLLHSGGGCAHYQDVPFLPTTAPVRRSPALAGSSDVRPEFLPSFSHRRESAAPGSYSVTLDPGSEHAVRAGLTATTRSGVARFRFPRLRRASVLVNTGASANANWLSEVRVDPSRREVSGASESGRFCYQRNRYRVYFAARFSRRFAAHGVWRDQTLVRGGRRARDTAQNPSNYKPIPGGPPSQPGNPSTSSHAGAYVSFDTRRAPRVGVRVGVSFTSVAAARRNLRAETAGRDFTSLCHAARARWNRQLGRIRVSGGSRRHTRLFYSNLYRALIHPNVFSDADGRYRGFDDRVRRARGFTKYANFSGWDVYRSQIPLLALIAPRRTGQMVSSLLADAEQSGCLGKFPLANDHTNVMVGDAAAPIIAGAHALGARNFDGRRALRALVKGATEDCRSPGNGDYVQREGLADYERLGYVPSERDAGAVAHTVDPDLIWGTASTTLEYNVADFAIARLAGELGDEHTRRRLQERSGSWRRLFNPASGYIEPRSAEGAFKPGYDPLGGEGFTEGNAAQYTWMVPFDPAGLFERMGGRAAALRRLDAHTREINGGPESDGAFLGNEPSQGTPWLYDWLGRPDRTQKLVRRGLLELFAPTPKGYPGNDDFGQMSAWWVLGALGLYPAVPGADVIALASPLFPRAQVKLGGRPLEIVGRGAAPERPYVRSLRLNGGSWRWPWICRARLAGRLEFELGPRPDRAWGSRPQAAPPSFGPLSGARGNGAWPSGCAPPPRRRDRG
ncbi:MAG TPA: GH92 family glycosyl hydrolase [Thermoleophilaceae bacterium]|jgi:predicted alpha-1,2-mannosidase|nr:GH92 family glycosyl hydrolase [Thermoleophilaceae bacterium]